MNSHRNPLLTTLLPIVSLTFLLAVFLLGLWSQQRRSIDAEKAAGQRRRQAQALALQEQAKKDALEAKQKRALAAQQRQEARREAAAKRKLEAELTAVTAQHQTHEPVGLAQEEADRQRGAGSQEAQATDQQAAMMAAWQRQQAAQEEFDASYSRAQEAAETARQQLQSMMLQGITPSGGSVQEVLTPIRVELQRMDQLTPRLSPAQQQAALQAKQRVITSARELGSLVGDYQRALEADRQRGIR